MRGKCNKLSIELLNQAINEENFGKSVILFHKSLCLAENYEQKEICIKLRNGKLQKIENSENFFKFSHPPNQLNSSIIDCIEMRFDDKFGRYLITTKSLKTGEIVIKEKSFLKSLDMNFTHGRCSNCLKRNDFKLIPCDFCHSIMFCSYECKNECWEKFHKFECDEIDNYNEDDNFYLMVQRSFFEILWICKYNFDKLQKLIENEINSIFDLNCQNDFISDKLISVFSSLESSPVTKDEYTFAKSFVKNHKHVKKLSCSINHQDILIELILKIITVMNRNAFTMHWPSRYLNDVEEQGCGIFLTVSMLNHSCSPNLIRIRRDDEIILITRRPIQKGEQLFICYQ